MEHHRSALNISDWKSPRLKAERVEVEGFLGSKYCIRKFGQDARSMFWCLEGRYRQEGYFSSLIPCYSPLHSCFGAYPGSMEKHSTKKVLIGVMLPQICTIKPDCIHEYFMKLLLVSGNRWQIGSHINNLLLADRACTSPHISNLWWMISSYSYFCWGLPSSSSLVSFS